MFFLLWDKEEIIYVNNFSPLTLFNYVMLLMSEGTLNTYGILSHTLKSKGNTYTFKTKYVFSLTHKGSGTIRNGLTVGMHT